MTKEEEKEYLKVFLKKFIDEPFNWQHLKEDNLNEQTFAEYSSLHKIIHILGIKIASDADIKKEEQPDFISKKHLFCLEVTSVDSGDGINRIVDRFYKKYLKFLKNNRIPEHYLHPLSFCSIRTIYQTMPEKLEDNKLKPSLLIKLIEDVLCCEKLNNSDPIQRYYTIKYTIEFIEAEAKKNSPLKNNLIRVKELLKKIIACRELHIEDFSTLITPLLSSFVQEKLQIDISDMCDYELTQKLYYNVVDSIIISHLKKLQNEISKESLESLDLTDYVISQSHESNQICLIKQAIDIKFEKYKDKEQKEGYRNILAVKLFTSMFSIFEKSKAVNMRNQLLNCLNSLLFNKQYFDTIIIIGNMKHDNQYWLFEYNECWRFRIPPAKANC